MSPFAYPLLATFLLTGGRRSEVLGLELDDVSFEATRMEGQSVTVDGPYVDARLKELSRDEDLSRYIL